MVSWGLGGVSSVLDLVVGPAVREDFLLKMLKYCFYSRTRTMATRTTKTTRVFRTTRNTRTIWTVTTRTTISRISSRTTRTNKNTRTTRATRLMVRTRATLLHCYFDPERDDRNAGRNRDQRSEIVTDREKPIW